MKTLPQRLTAVGFAVVDTGGGCTAWRVELRSGGYIMVTDDASHEITDGIAIGIYDADGEEVCLASQEGLGPWDDARYTVTGGVSPSEDDEAAAEEARDKATRRGGVSLLNFEVTNNGGGCKVWRADRDEVTYIISAQGEPDMPQDGEPVSLGMYFDDAWMDGRNAAYYGDFAVEADARNFADMLAQRVANLDSAERTVWTTIAREEGGEGFEDILNEAAETLAHQGFLIREKGAGVDGDMYYCHVDHDLNRGPVPQIKQAPVSPPSLADEVRDASIVLYDAFCRANGLQLGSADEELIFNPTLTAAQRAWLNAYVALWEATGELL